MLNDNTPPPRPRHEWARPAQDLTANPTPDGPNRWPDGAIVFSETWEQFWTWQRAGAPLEEWEAFRDAPPRPRGPITMCWRGDPKGSDPRGLDDGEE